MKLTIKQEKFCNCFIECGNASDAYRMAYPTDNMKPETVNRKAYEMLENGKVSARIAEIQKHIRDKSEITKEKLLSELSNIAFSSIADMHKTWIEREEFEKLTAKQKSAIKSISTKVLKKNVGTREMPEIIDVEYVKIELHDKLKAIERICKMLGFDSPTEINVKKEEDDIPRDSIIKELERLEELDGK